MHHGVVEEDGIEVSDEVDRAGGTRDGSLVDRVRGLASARWPRVLRVAVATAAVVTVVATLVSLGRTDVFVAGDVASLAFGTTMTVVLVAGIDERLSETSRTFARWGAILATGYTLAALATVVAALP